MQVLAICCMSILLVSLDNTIVNVALPTIHRDLGASLSQLQWIVDAYTVVLATPADPERLDRRPDRAQARLHASGSGSSRLGSLLCSAAPSPGWLIAFRALQGVGGSMLNPVAMSIIRNVFTDPRERAQAIGVWGGVVGISMALGPVRRAARSRTRPAGARSSGSTCRSASSRSCSSRVSCPSRARRGRGGSTRSARCWRWSSWPRSPTRSSRAATPAGARRRVQVSAIVAAASLIGFVAHERRAPEPLIDLRFFRSVPFTGATLTAIAAFIALGGFLLVTNLYLQVDRGLSPVHGGLYTLPMAALAFVAAPLSGRIVGRRGARVPLRGRRARPRRREPDPHAAHAHHRHRRPAPGLLGLRPRLRDGQPADHERRRVRHAGRPGGRGGGRRVHEPAGRAYRSGVAIIGSIVVSSQRCRRRQHRRGEPSRLVDLRGLRARGRRDGASSRRPSER